MFGGDLTDTQITVPLVVFSNDVWGDLTDTQITVPLVVFSNDVWCHLTDTQITVRLVLFSNDVWGDLTDTQITVRLVVFSNDVWGDLTDKGVANVLTDIMKYEFSSIIFQICVFYILIIFIYICLLLYSHRCVIAVLLVCLLKYFIYVFIYIYIYIYNLMDWWEIYKKNGWMFLYALRTQVVGWMDEWMDGCMCGVFGLGNCVWVFIF